MTISSPNYQNYELGQVGSLAKNKVCKVELDFHIYVISKYSVKTHSVTALKVATAITDQVSPSNFRLISLNGNYVTLAP